MKRIMGRMLTGWQLIDGKWYYFETAAGSSQGRMYHAERTPDGYYVGTDGVWDGDPANADSASVRTSRELMK